MPAFLDDEDSENTQGKPKRKTEIEDAIRDLGFQWLPKKQSI